MCTRLQILGRGKGAWKTSLAEKPRERSSYDAGFLNKGIGSFNFCYDHGCDPPRPDYSLSCIVRDVRFLLTCF